MQLFSRILLILVLGGIAAGIILFSADAVDATTTVVLCR